MNLKTTVRNWLRNQLRDWLSITELDANLIRLEVELVSVRTDLTILKDEHQIRHALLEAHQSTLRADLDAITGRRFASGGGTSGSLSLELGGDEFQG